MKRPRLAARTALAAALLSSVGWAALDRSAAAARARTAQHLEEIRAERESWSFEREALWGETRDEAAWPHYAAALARLSSEEKGSRRTTMRRILRASAADDGADPEERASLLDEYGDLLDDVRRGAHARDPRMEIPWDQGFSVPLPSLVDNRSMSLLALMRLLEAVGTAEELDAVRGLLDVQQLARDLMATPLLISEMVGISLIVPADMEMHLQQGLAQKLSEESKREWLAGLRRLEASLPRSGRSLLGEAELAGRAFTSGLEPKRSAGSGSFYTRLESFKNGFFLDVHVADHVSRMRILAGEVERAGALPGAAGLDRIGELQAGYGEPSNAVSAFWSPRILQNVAHSRAYGRQRLALLRHALELHLGEPGTLPEDLFGTGVFVDRSEGRIRVHTAPHKDPKTPGTIEVVL